METALARNNVPDRGRVLVVDDEAHNRELLHDLLAAQGHEVLEAADGKEALRVATEHVPDVVLLDVMMPELDGFEVCRRLKAQASTAALPILMVTALADRENRIQGIAAGANDFLTKPIDIHEVQLRVRNALRLKKLFDRVQDDYRRLQELETLRDNLTGMIVHDMRSPLTGIRGYLQLSLMIPPEKMDHDLREYLGHARHATEVLIEMVSSLLDVSRLEAGSMPLDRQPHDMRQLIPEALQSLGALLQNCQVRFEPAGGPLPALCDEHIVRRIVANLVSNAIKFTPAEGSVVLTGERQASAVKISVRDTGAGIPKEYHTKIFEKFGQVANRKENRKYSTGLGLTFCKLAVEAHGGQIGVESVVGQGSTFWFTLPT
jgi:signal transduction histidine kinase